jgi:hypothetical protein
MCFGPCPVYIVEVAVVQVTHRQDVVHLVTLRTQLDVVDVERAGAAQLPVVAEDDGLACPAIPPQHRLAEPGVHPPSPRWLPLHRRSHQWRAT